MSLMILASLALLVPVPMTTGNVTAARWVYNIWDDHEKKDEAARIAGIDRDVSHITEARNARSLITMQLKLQALQNDRTHVENTPYYQGDEKERKVRRIDDRLDKLYEEMNRKNIRLEDLQSFNDNQMLLAYKL